MKIIRVMAGERRPYWDSTLSSWYFYAPTLSGTALTGYIANKGYLDFFANNKTLGNGTGFWVNRPQ